MKALTICLLGYWLIMTSYFHIQNVLEPNMSYPLGIRGPVEIAYAGGSYFTEVWYFLKSRWLPLLFALFIMPAGIGLLVYGVLRWRHPGYKASVIRTLLLSVLVWSVWAVISDFARPHNTERQSYGLLTLAIAVCLGIEAAKFGYYKGRVRSQAVKHDYVKDTSSLES